MSIRVPSFTAKTDPAGKTEKYKIQYTYLQQTQIIMSSTMRSDKRNNPSKKTSKPQNANSNKRKSKPQKTNSDRASEPVCDKIYPGHATFGELTNTSSHTRSLQHLRNDVPDDVRDHLDDIIYDLSRSEKKHFLKVISSLSDDQYHHVTTHIASMFDFRECQYRLRRGRYFFRIGMRILAGAHPRARDPRLSITPSIKMPEIGITLETPEWLELQERLNNLPLEIFDMIKEIAVEDILVNTSIYPHHDRSGTYNAAKSSEEWLPCELLKAFRLEKQRKAISKRLFRDNMYVVGPGDVVATTKFLTQSRERLQKKIRRLQLILNHEDFYVSASDRPLGNYKGLWDEFLLFMNADRPCYDRPRSHLFCGFTRPRNQTLEDSIECPEAWIAKLDIVLERTKADIKELVLDLTDAYSPDGMYVGEKIARWVRFKRGRVPKLQIRAPTIELEAKIRQVILDMNGLDMNGLEPKKPTIVTDYASQAAREASAPQVAMSGSVNPHEESVPQLQIQSFSN